MRKFLLFSAISFLLIPLFGFNSLITNVSATVEPPQQPEPWFEIKSVQFDLPADFPAKASAKFNEGQKSIQFRNKSETPIYFGFEDVSDHYKRTLQYHTKSEYESITAVQNPNGPDYPQQPGSKLVNGELYNYYQRERHRHDEIDRDYWRHADPEERGGNKQVSDAVDYFNVHVLSDSVKSVLHKSGDRPEDVEIPEPKPFSVEVFYDGQFHSISGTVSFTLNEDNNSNIEPSTTFSGDTAPSWVETLDEILEEFENMWERLF